MLSERFYHPEVTFRGDRGLMSPKRPSPGKCISHKKSRWGPRMTDVLLLGLSGFATDNEYFFISIFYL
jgi:hypothetical protein